MSPRHILLAALSAGSLALGIGQVSAAPFSPDLVIIDEDKRFSNFTCSVVGAGTFSGGCATLDITALTGDTGLRFQNGWIVVNAGSTLDMLIGYHVEVLDPTQEIESITLAFNGATSGGLAIASVTETATEPGVGVTGQAIVNEPPTGPLSTEVFLSETAKELDILKDILLVSFEDGARATISFIDQDFHQTGDNVPEPMTLALFGSGLIGLGLIRRRYARA